MATKKKTMKYQNRDIRFEHVSDEKTRVTVDAVEFETYCDPETKRFSTIAFPYVDFDSLEDLVKAVIDKHPDFRR